MIRHISLGKTTYGRSKALHQLIAANKICLGGNSRLKIFGLLSCKSGKRMKPENRVFFLSEKAAIDNGYRPCGMCMKEAYKRWKKNKTY
jgi:hypothetical protein